MSPSSPGAGGTSSGSPSTTIDGSYANTSFAPLSCTCARPGFIVSRFVIVHSTDTSRSPTLTYGTSTPSSVVRSARSAASSVVSSRIGSMCWTLAADSAPVPSSTPASSDIGPGRYTGSFAHAATASRATTNDRPHD